MMDKDALRSALLEVFRQECDGTFSDDPSTWSIYLDKFGAMTVPEFVDKLVERLT